MATNLSKKLKPKSKKFKNKKILITAGPTWVPIDAVRVISNIATGKTGVLLADKLSRLGAKVTLLLGPVESCCLNKNIRLIRFKFFEELKNKLEKELKSKKYDILIHSAAVSDFRPVVTYSGKINSQEKNFLLKLKATPKLIGLFKKRMHSLFVIAFKFEPKAKIESLIREAKMLQNKYSCDLVVANTIFGNRYLAYIVGKSHFVGPLGKKEHLVQGLIKTIKNII